MWLEIKRLIKSPIYWVVLVVLVLFWYRDFKGVTQEEVEKSQSSIETKVDKTTINKIDTNKGILVPPVDNGEYAQPEEKPEKIMMGAVDQLLRQYEDNSYTTYPSGYYKAVKLSESKQKEVLTVLKEITGLDEIQLANLPDDYFPAQNGTIFRPSGYTDEGIVTTKEERFHSQVTYERFQELMETTRKLIGKNSEFEPEFLQAYFGSDVSQKEAQQDYQNTVEEDLISRGFARYFCDVLSTPVSLLPMFLTLLLWIFDRKKGLCEVLNVSRCASWKIILSRTGAVLICIMVPITLLSVEGILPLSDFAKNNQLQVDYLAFLKYSFWWLLPTILISVAIVTFCWMLTYTSVGILLVGIWWFLARGAGKIVGGTEWYSFVIRHNSLLDREAFINDSSTIFVNRSGFILLSMILLTVSVKILDSRRKGWRLRDSLPATIQNHLQTKF